jgi:PIN domain nuclease of toxin-antitoxin system
MTRYLLETHSLLWFMAGDEHLSPRARAVMEDLENELLLSSASLWEIAIKVSLGKLPLKEPYETLIPRQLTELGIQVLEPEIDDYVAVTVLPLGAAPLGRRS